MGAVYDAFEKAFTEYLRKKGFDVKTLTYWEEEDTDYGYCETCSYTVREIHFSYVDSKGNSRSGSIAETFAELMRDL